MRQGCDRERLMMLSVNDNYGDAIGIRAEANENDIITPLVTYAADGDITVSRSDGTTAVLSRPGSVDSRVALPRRDLA